jgi:hypothetical protein
VQGASRMPRSCSRDSNYLCSLSRALCLEIDTSLFSYYSLTIVTGSTVLTPLGSLLIKASALTGPRRLQGQGICCNNANSKT